MLACDELTGSRWDRDRVALHRDNDDTVAVYSAGRVDNDDVVTVS